MSDAALVEARDAHAAGDNAINNLILAGYTERAAVTGVLIASIGRAIASGGNEATANWLRYLADGIAAGKFDAP